MRIFVMSCIAAAAVAGIAHPSPAVAKTCALPKYPGSGYFTALSVSHTSCATARKLALAFYRCRLEHGKAGRCSRHVLGFACSERRQSIPTEIDATVRCRKGAARVVHSYQQNL